MAVPPHAAPSQTPPSQTPQAEYTRRLHLHEQNEARLKSTHLRTGYVRLALVILFLLTAWFTIFQHDAPRWLIALPVLLFIAAGIFHARVLRRLSSARRAAQVYRLGIARVEDRWHGLNPRNLNSLSPALAAKLSSSLYALDLDIIGTDGLFELLCTARTRMGEEMLLTWLLEPAPVAEALQRQAAVAELRTLLDLRERMSVAGDSTVVGINPTELLAWAQATDTLRQSWLPWLAALLSLTAVAALIAWLSGLGNLALLAFFVILVLQSALRKPFKAHIDAVLQHSDSALKSLTLLSDLMAQLEPEAFDAPLLVNLKRRLCSHDTLGSIAIARLATLGAYRDSLYNMIVKAIDLPLMYSAQVAFAIQRWHRRHSRAIPAWLQAVAEAEALLSLATYSYEHPDDSFPQLLDGAARLSAIDVGHPFIAASKCVRNSLHLGPQAFSADSALNDSPATRVLLISGSNMSGKSTLMRTIGVNVVLALCGAPVRARSLSLTPLRIGASLLVNDSLHEGHSRFYAEIDRLHRIVVLADSVTANGGDGVLFLLDELLQGTNSADRLTGATGVIRTLVQLGAIGIATTHDLALADILGLPSGSLRNMHFQDQIVDDQMHFDFTLREGAAMKSNGVALMRLIGLNV